MSGDQGEDVEVTNVDGANGVYQREACVLRVPQLSELSQD